MNKKHYFVDLYFIIVISFSLVCLSFAAQNSQPDIIFNHFPDGTTQMHFNKHSLTEEEALDVMTRFIIKRERGDLFDEEKKKIKNF